MAFKKEKAGFAERISLLNRIREVFDKEKTPFETRSDPAIPAVDSQEQIMIRFLEKEYRDRKTLPDAGKPLVYEHIPMNGKPETVKEESVKKEGSAEEGEPETGGKETETDEITISLEEQRLDFEDRDERYRSGSGKAGIEISNSTNTVPESGPDISGSINSREQTENPFRKNQSSDPFRSGREFSRQDPFQESGITDIGTGAEATSDLRVQAARAAISKVKQASKDVTGDLTGKTGTSGDAVSDGLDGAAGSFLNSVNPLTYVKNLWMSLGLLALPTLSAFGSVLSVILVIVMLLTAVMTPVAEASGAVADFLNLYFPGGGEYTDSQLSEAEIDRILTTVTGTESQKAAVRFALSKVGYPYSQANRESGWAYDCSSFAYYSWRAGGRDISYGGGYAPTAASEASNLADHGKTVSTTAEFTMEPGDLIFYGGSDNGRFMGIYHVAVYVGNGMAAEALGDEWGCVYQPVRPNNVCLVCRP